MNLPSQPALTLADLQPGDHVRVVAIAKSDDPVYQRLLHMGLIRGRSVEVVRKAPAGDPIEIRFLGYSLSLRLSEARRVSVRRVA